MTLGIDHSEPRRLRRKRTAWFVASGFFTSVFLLFVGGTTYALTAPGYAWGEGELPIEIIMIVVSALFALFAGLRGRRLGDQAADLEDELSPYETLWLPSDPEPVDAEVAAMTPRLRVYSHRAALLCGAWVVALTLGVSGFFLMELLGQRLLDEGARTVGTVVSVHDARRGTSTITVEYVERDDVRLAIVNRDSDRDYTPGQLVTVVYDPADPERVRTLSERNDNGFLTFGSYFLAIVACIGIPCSAVAAQNWRRRHQAVLGSGWHAGRAHISHYFRQVPRISVTYRDGSGIELKGSTSTHAPPAFGEVSDVPVWVGGESRSMVVLLPRGRIRDALHAVPVYADGPRRHLSTDGGAPVTE
ncbi:DUF3592 domain-containing protein [Amycolatopsis sp.]|jgi:hypothetical protein|uniref:DUF3592 domain-containing protein n=1 Tax=Amycolatopsis sp. TaxID=37632 RepID=UPI002E0529F1|nr:DUF3592 domain-containing protein [Amycolatopsis sp.]